MDFKSLSLNLSTKSGCDSYFFPEAEMKHVPEKKNADSHMVVKVPEKHKHI